MNPAATVCCKHDDEKGDRWRIFITPTLDDEGGEEK